MSNHKRRASVASSVVNETCTLVSSHASEGATLSSTFYRSLKPLARTRRSPNHTHQRLTRVVNSDSFAAARALISTAGVGGSTVAVLNLASDERPGGGWRHTLCTTQEEALCYSSTLYATLKPEYYPWDNNAAAGIFSPGVVVHRDTLDNGCRLLPQDQRVVVGVVTVAAPRWPATTKDRCRFRDDEMRLAFREKVRAVYRMAAREGRDNLVLGAMGCGAYGCPKEEVAEIMRDVLTKEEEFKGWFDNVWWAVVDPIHDGNESVFQSVCGGVEIP